MRIVKERQVRETPDHPTGATIAVNPCKIAPFWRRTQQEYIPCMARPTGVAVGHISVFDVPPPRMRTSAKPSLPFVAPHV
jgi:hypothetical protein